MLHLNRQHAWRAGTCFAFLLGLAALASLPLAAQDPSKPAPPGKAHLDLRGDPLPEGAVARLGTLRWRHADTVTFVAILPDGKAVLTAAQDNTVRLWQR